MRTSQAWDVTSRNEFEMTDSITRDPAITRDAKAWRHATGVKYTEALRAVEDPLHQGILGDRIVVRDLLRLLEEHPIIGAKHASSTFGRRGLQDDEPMSDGLSSRRLSEVLLAVEFLRIFSPVTAADRTEQNEVSSYALKHMAEEFLGSTVGGYLPNGALIWAAAVLDLPMRESLEPGLGRNTIVYLPWQEIEYMHAGQPSRISDRHGEHFQPPGYARLEAVVKCANSGEPFGDALTIPLTVRADWSEFHLWIADQIHRDGLQGRFASDYVAGVNDSDHRPARSGEDLLEILRGIRIDFDFLEAAEALVAEYDSLTPNH